MATSKRLNSGDIRRLKRSLDITAFYDLPLDDGEVVVSAGSTSNSVSQIVFSNANNVTFGLAGSTVTAIAGTGAAGLTAVNVSAGTLASNVSAITFSNGSGVSFGFDGSNITATVATNYQSQGAYLTTAMNSTNPVVQSVNGSNGQISLSQSGLVSISNNNSTIVVSARSLSLDEVQNPANDAVFFMNTRQVQLQWGSNLTSFSTAASRGGLFEIDVVGGSALTSMTGHIDVLHVHQSVDDPPLHMLHVECGGTRATGIHMDIAGAAAIELNAPVSFYGGSVPMILGTSQSNSVSNLNANYLQGALSSQFAGTNTSVQTTAGTDLSCALNTSGLTIAYPLWITTYVNDLTSQRAGTATSVATTAGTDLSMALNTNGLTVAYAKWLTTAAATNITSDRAGTNTGATGCLVTANTSGVSVSILGFNTLSCWANMPFVNGTTSYTLQSNSVNVQPFTIPNPLSVSYLRIPVSFANLTSTTVAYTSGSRSFYYYQSINAVLYSQGVGASSRSLQYLASSRAEFTEAFLFSISNAGTNESIAYQITYPIEGANTSNSGTTMVTTAAGASIYLHTTGAMTAFSGIHWLDIPIATLFNPGCYWLALNRSTATTTSGAGIAITGNVNRVHSLIAVSQINSNFVPLGFASSGAATASTQPNWQIGLGSHSVSAQGATTSSLALSSVSSVANFPIIPMQFIRQA